MVDCSLPLLQYCMYVFRELGKYFVLFIFGFEASCFSSDSKRLVLSKMGADYLSNVVISFLSLLFAQDT